LSSNSYNGGKRMTARTLILIMVIGGLSAPLLAQGNSCREFTTWGYGGGAGNGPQPIFWPTEPFQGEVMENLQATWGGVGPTCSAVWLGNASGGWSGGCASYAWTCAPPAPPVGGCSSCTTAGQPIDLSSGNTYIKRTDVRLPGLGGGLTLSRTWSSMGGGGIFGAGWTSNYDESVYPGNDGTMKYLRSDGSVWSFALVAVNNQVPSPPVYQLIAPANGQATMTELTSPPPPGSSFATISGWMVTFENGEQRIFTIAPPFINYNGAPPNNGGPLTLIIDRNGNATALTYQVNQGGSLHPLLSVTDPVGRHLYFTYNISGVLTNVSSDPGSGINVTYTPVPTIGGGSQWVVTQADGTFETFTYDVFGNVVQVTDTYGKIL